MCTYYVRVNVTLSIDDELLTRVRALASRRGTSLNQMVRDYLAEVAAEQGPDEILSELERLWSEAPGASEGRKWTRDELHERTVIR